MLCAAFIAALPVNFVKAADNESTERNVLNEKSDDITEVRSSKASAAVKTGEAKVSFLIAFVRTKPDGSSKIRAIYIGTEKLLMLSEPKEFTQKLNTILRAARKSMRIFLRRS